MSKSPVSSHLGVGGTKRRGGGATSRLRVTCSEEGVSGLKIRVRKHISRELNGVVVTAPPCRCENKTAVDFSLAEMKGSGSDIDVDGWS